VAIGFTNYEKFINEIKQSYTKMSQENMPKYISENIILIQQKNDSKNIYGKLANNINIVHVLIKKAKSSEKNIKPIGVFINDKLYFYSTTIMDLFNISLKKLFQVIGIFSITKKQTQLNEIFISKAIDISATTADNEKVVYLLFFDRTTNEFRLLISENVFSYFYLL
jgi:hypothetical protein